MNQQLLFVSILVVTTLVFGQAPSTASAADFTWDPIDPTPTPGRDEADDAAMPHAQPRYPIARSTGSNEGDHDHV